MPPFFFILFIDNRIFKKLDFLEHLLLLSRKEIVVERFPCGVTV
nr:MAG TPA: hypothetical protein [Caudoviricetes sp.]